MIELKITGMDCADCAAKLERGIGKIEGVQSCAVNFVTGKMQLAGAPDLHHVQERIEALGYGVAENDAPAPESPHFLNFMWARRETQLALIGIIGLALSFGLNLANAPVVLAHGLQLAVIAIVGTPIIRLGLRQFWLSREVTINLLMSIATLGALAIGEWEEAATVIVLFSIGEALEGYSADRVRGALGSLLKLAPQEALVMRPCMDCEEHLGQNGYTGGACPFCEVHEHQIPVSEVQLGDTVVIPPGSRVPIDGSVISGISAVDQSPITGESIPVDKITGDLVYAGSVNGAGALQIKVTNLAQDSTLARIIRLVESAQAQKAPSERFVNQFAKWYTPAVIVVAALVALIPPVFFSADWNSWLYRALALLVVACPCALVISTPVAVVSAMVRAAQQGILIKGGVYLETLGKIKAIAFDKTGTLTTGKPHVIEAHSFECQGENCDPCNDMVALASAVERQSEHPLGKAVVQAARQRGVLDRFAPALEVMSLAGRGVQGQVATQPITVGSHQLFDDSYPHSTIICDNVTQFEKRGQTVMMVAESDKVLGYITVSDTPRESAKQALSELTDIHKIMLTGDNASAASAIAAQVGIDEVKASLLPQDKVTAIQKLVAEYGDVAMVGDGVNDAPALAAATVGIAMGGAGTAQAMETADVVLMKDDLSQLPNAIKISRQAGRVIRQNVSVSLLTKLAFLILTIPGWTTLWMAVFADTGIALLVTMNGLRLLRKEKASV